MLHLLKSRREGNISFVFCLSSFIYGTIITFIQRNGEASAGSHVDGDFVGWSAMEGVYTIGVGMGLPIGIVPVAP